MQVHNREELALKILHYTLDCLYTEFTEKFLRKKFLREQLRSVSIHTVALSAHFWSDVFTSMMINFPGFSTNFIK
jgi:hypothetical protein